MSRGHTLAASQEDLGHGGASAALPRAQSRVTPTQMAVCAPTVTAGADCPATAVSTLTQAHLPAHLVNSWLWSLELGALGKGAGCE